MAENAELDIDLDRPLPATLPMGRGTAVFCVGSCFHPLREVREIAITVNGVRHTPMAQRMPRLDRFRAIHGMDEERSIDIDGSALDPLFRSYRSGFWSIIPLTPAQLTRPVELAIETRLDDGTTASGSLGTIDVTESRPLALEDPPRAEGKSPIAICMATYNPDPELFRIQIESIRAQTDTGWFCLISDDCSSPERFETVAETIAGDPRFTVSRSDERLGFYRNFERALRMVPEGIELVALCDHDDRWYPDKLAMLRAAIGSAGLAYSDLRRVDASGDVRSQTLWEGRRRNDKSLASLLVSNTIPGAACLFRRRVIERALPFPDGPGWDFHDHWLALVALALGEVAYVDRPLYDYVQHAGAVLGRVTSAPGASAESAPRPGLRERIGRGWGFFGRWRAAYFNLYLQRALLAWVLLVRCAGELTSGKRRALQRLIAAASSPPAFAWLVARQARGLFGRNETLRMEAVLAKGILWRHLILLRALGRKRPRGLKEDASLPSFDPQGFGPSRRRWLASRR